MQEVSSTDWGEYSKWWEKQNSFSAKFLRGIKPIHLLLFIILIAIGYSLWSGGGTNKNFIVIVIVGIIALIIIMNIKQTGKINPIPENVAWLLAQRELDRKVSNNQVPTGTIFNPTIISKLIYWGEAGTGNEPVAYRWKLLFRIKMPNNLEREMIVSLHPYFGYLTGIYPGSEKELNQSDIKIVFPETYLVKPAEEKKEGKV